MRFLVAEEVLGDYVDDGKENVLFAMPFCTKSDEFTKTGSGQT